MAKSTSSYQRHGKRPYKYSAALNRWHKNAYGGAPNAKHGLDHDVHVFKDRGPMPGWSWNHEQKVRNLAKVTDND